jgi:hypothetical protein
MVEVGSYYILWEGKKKRIIVVETFLKPPSMNRLSRKCEILDVSQLYRPSRPVSGIVFLYCIHCVCNVCFILCVLCFVSAWCFIVCDMCIFGPSLWSSGHSFRLQIHRSGFDFRRYRIFEELWVWNWVHSAS